MDFEKFDPTLYGWKINYESIGITSYKKTSDIKLTYNKVEDIWAITLDIGILAPIFVGRIDINKDYQGVARFLCFDKAKVSKIIKL